MRELDECTAEVFRRSEKRIKERARNRSRAFAACLPVCLIAAAWSAIIFSGIMPEMEISDRAPAAEAVNGNAGGSLACPYISVEIQDAGLFPEGHYGKVTDTAAVAELFHAIHSLFEDVDRNDRDASENFPVDENFPAEEDNVYDDQTGSASKPKVCTITFTAEDGSQAVYILGENTLVDAETKETIILSDAQAAGLMAVFGISE